MFLWNIYCFTFQIKVFDLLIIFYIVWGKGEFFIYIDIHLTLHKLLKRTCLPHWSVEPTCGCLFGSLFLDSCFTLLAPITTLLNYCNFTVSLATWQVKFSSYLLLFLYPLLLLKIALAIPYKFPCKIFHNIMR